VHVVGHHNPGDKLIEMSLAFPNQNGAGDGIGNLRLTQPEWAGGRTVHGTVCGDECVGSGGADNIGR